MAIANPTESKKVKARLEHKKGPFLQAFSKIGTIQGAAAAVGISRYAVLDWRRNDPAFKEAFDKAESQFTEEIESVVHDMALKRDLGACIFLLKARAPQKYTERYRHEIESAQFNKLIGLMTAVVKRVVPRQLWPVIASELDNVANTLEAGDATAHLLQ